MIVVSIKPAGYKHVYQVRWAMQYSDEFHFEAPRKRAVSCGHTAILMRPGDGRKPRKGECINARKFLGV